MRISNTMVYESGVRTIGDQMSRLLQTEQSLASGRRIQTPSDDPVNAARALVVSEAKDINAQYGLNQGNAKDSLALEESQMSSISDVLVRVRELAVQGGDASLSTENLYSIATELRARFTELLGLANNTDSNGDFIFAGNMGATTPFGGNVDALLASPASDISYFGDSGQRRLQVSATRFMEISDPGDSIFRNIKTGNGTFTVDYAAGNTGTAIADAGSVSDTALWNAVPDKNLTIKFYIDSTVTPNVTYYDLLDSTAPVPNSLLTGAAAVAPPAAGWQTGLRVYHPNDVIDFSGLSGGADYGINVRIDGDPADGDSFTIAPSTSQSLFKTLSNLIGALESRLGNPTPPGSAALANEIGQSLTNIDQALDNVLRIRAGIGSRLNELESLGSINEDVDVRYQETLSHLQDVDYARAITELHQHQTNLEAAQKSFMKVTQLSLFNYL